MPVAVEVPVEKHRGAAREVTIGAGPEVGDSRKEGVAAGGETTLPFLFFEGDMPNLPVVAVEITEQGPAGWSPALTEARIDVVSDLAEWTAGAEEVGAGLI